MIMGTAPIKVLHRHYYYYCSAKSLPRLTRGGGIAVIYRGVLQHYSLVVTTSDFEHASLELIMHFKLSVSQCSIHFLFLSRPSPNKKNRLIESVRMFVAFVDIKKR